MAELYSARGTAENIRQFLEGMGTEAQSPHRTFFSSEVIHQIAPKRGFYEEFARIEKWVKGAPRFQSALDRQLGQLIAGVGVVNQVAHPKPQPPKDDSLQVGDEAVVTVGGYLPPIYAEPTWLPGRITIALSPGMAYQPGEVFVVGKVGAEYVYLIPQDQAAEAADGGDYTYLKIKSSTLARHFHVDHRSQSEDQNQKSTGPQVTRATTRPTAEQTQQAVLKVVEEAENEERERLIWEIISNPIVVLPRSQVPGKSILLYELEKAKIKHLFESMTTDQLKDFLREAKARSVPEIPDKSTLESVAGY